MSKILGHSFHIPVMGTGYTVDTPAKVAHLGISSVISIVDDILLEKMRELYCTKLSLPFSPITEKNKDFRAERITSYLNLMDKIVKEKFENLKASVQEKKEDLEEYLDMLPDFSELKKEFKEKFEGNSYVKEAKEWLSKNLPIGSIDVNIMTKLDKDNYYEGEQLPVEYNDAHAALRGFAMSNLESSMVLSAGMNPRLYGYLEQFEDFYPDETGHLRKKIVLKVSDYRSALIQGKFLAKKGIWVSEFRIESGLNCGGHAFATEGTLMGPILEEFKEHREELKNTLNEMLSQALQAKERTCPKLDLDIRITAQGGVGTAEEQEFLMDYYHLDSIGWGTPFLLVPEVCDVDEKTLHLLEIAEEKDLRLSYASPLGVRYNNLIANTRDKDVLKNFANNKPGSACTKKFMLSNTEFTEKPICTASIQYQKLKLADLKAKNLPEKEYNKEVSLLLEKTCLCKGLSASSFLVNHIDTKADGDGVSICPGPNLAYFSRKAKLKEMIDHIYNRTNLIVRTDRPHMFMKEMSLYVDYLKEQIDELQNPVAKQLRSLEKFKNNLLNGVDYYKDLSNSISGKFKNMKNQVSEDLEHLEFEIRELLISAEKQ
ncbi:hypothetical protein BZG02_06515 [Labilibaculum filiforme]|uniref:Uncharacterized protein n=1 Tax=Labilibaculum filiforme TaxID=1940526 RepID=A0A2N3I2C0_9BACT|nr:hypothetical protein [Labilibaculum filiforme]PKQ64455.1 hypothetical protein BZG02_06515 [Labilibaculum filiforme]